MQSWECGFSSFTDTGTLTYDPLCHLDVFCLLRGRNISCLHYSIQLVVHLSYNTISLSNAQFRITSFLSSLTGLSTYISTGYKPKTGRHRAMSSRPLFLCWWIAQKRRSRRCVTHPWWEQIAIRLANCYFCVPRDATDGLCNDASKKPNSCNCRSKCPWFLSSLTCNRSDWIIFVFFLDGKRDRE